MEDKKLRDRNDITEEGDYQNTFKEYGRYIKESVNKGEMDDAIEDSAEEEEDDEDKYLKEDEEDIEEEE